MILPSLRQPAVRDLAATIAAPGLLAQDSPAIVSDAECARELEAHADRLRALDQEPAPLLERLAATTKSHRLGHYFEALLGYWIGSVLASPHWQSGLKIARSGGDGDTLGELDFVFERANKPDAPVEHWEASVKFFLCNARLGLEPVETSQFLGTMSQDRLDQKIDKLLRQQLALPERPEARASLAAHGFRGPVRSRAFVKGALFYPARSDWRAHPHPPGISPRHLRGWWSRGFDFEAFPESSRWVMLPRGRWLSPYQTSALEEWQPLTHVGMREYCRGHFEDHRRALMLARVAREGDLWIETDRGFAVHAGWPGI